GLGGAATRDCIQKSSLSRRQNHATHVGRQSYSAYLRTLHGNPTQRRRTAVVECQDPVVPDQCANWAADARATGSARTVFDLMSAGLRGSEENPPERGTPNRVEH